MIKKFKIFEEYAYDRVIKRKREVFDKRSNASKKNQYDAKSVLKKLQKQYPDIQFSIIDYYSDSKAVFLSDDDDKGLFNKWYRDSDNYVDGLIPEFANWLIKHKLKWDWHSPKGMNWNDGICITSDDFRGHYWYYGVIDKPRKVKVREDKSSIKNIIDIFKKYNFDVYEAEDERNDSDGSDRDIVNMEKYGMTFRFEIMRRGNVEDHIKERINKFEQSMLRYFTLIKSLYEYCETVAEGPLWTMSGGGAQLQQFYGDDNGYMQILYLGMEDNRENDDDNRFSIQANGNNKIVSKEKILNNSKKIEIPDEIRLKKNMKKYNI